ncbi:lysoplasmalogenase [Gordonia desulfuricans]|uniref:Lysoplasmalogenase n=1 Tax=Gordonia desulfuricans TaxID=89051 RepID=A0A7K3LV64_9ACTN|nr:MULTISPECIES: lysoplasmalogenase family protein [Gordonia]EMP14261.2 hypothetical protein ISGA_755 [Gordonia sp. NB41Y]NDK92180.1 lysoplasmalogenase [Gordonia desulfuricans]WLP90596.1 lysoplasmalogenase family protein [Gordonia sp. NB41Y]
MSSSRLALLWLPYVLVSLIHVVAVAVESPLAPPTKLLLMPLLAVPVLAAAGRLSSTLTMLLLAALTLSWIGDGAGVVLSGDAVLPVMLGAFGLAHLAYIAAFTRQLSIHGFPRWAWVYAAWWIAMVAVIGPHAGALLIPVLLYGIVLAGTAATSTRCVTLIAAGGAFFLTSDSLLGIRLFLPDVAPGWFSPAVMATYTLGQGLIIAGAVRATQRVRVAT